MKINNDNDNNDNNNNDINNDNNNNGKKRDLLQSLAAHTQQFQ